MLFIFIKQSRLCCLIFFSFSLFFRCIKMCKHGKFMMWIVMYMMFCATNDTYFNSWDSVALITLPHRQKFATSVSGCDFDYSPPMSTTTMTLSSPPLRIIHICLLKLNLKFQVNIWRCHASLSLTHNVHKLNNTIKKYKITLNVDRGQFVVTNILRNQYTKQATHKICEETNESKKK